MPDEEEAVRYAPGARREADRGTLSEEEAFEDTRPGATAQTFAAQTGKDRGDIPGAEDVEDGPVAGSALPTEQGRRGASASKDRREG